MKNEYETSRDTAEIEGIGIFSRKLKDDAIASFSADDRTRTGQKVVDAVCESLGVQSVKLTVKDSPQRHRDDGMGRTRSKTLGSYTYSGNQGLGITVWNKTAKKLLTVSGKTFFGTLLHEICHHIDITKLGFDRSPHTAGFYRRISYLDSRFVG